MNEGRAGWSLATTSAKLLLYGIYSQVTRFRGFPPLSLWGWQLGCEMRMWHLLRALVYLHGDWMLPGSPWLTHLLSQGNGMGEVILFEPSTSEHISARTIFDPINALAPAAECRTYAIGYNIRNLSGMSRDLNVLIAESCVRYQNGSILISTLRPAFTILHTVTASRGPSAIVGLAWHVSSSKRKSDMLATDLRVWSMAKPPTGESPRVIGVLKCSEPLSVGPKWIA